MSSVRHTTLIIAHRCQAAWVATLAASRSTLCNGARIFSIEESKSGYTCSIIVDTQDDKSAPEFAMKLFEQLPGVWHRVCQKDERSLCTRVISGKLECPKRG